MKKILLIVLLPLWSFGQVVDSVGHFYARDGQISWESGYDALKRDAPTLRQQLIEQLEGIDGIEIINSSNPDIIRGRIRDAKMSQKQVLFQDVKFTLSGEFRIWVKFEGYSVKVTSMGTYSQTGALAGNVANSLEAMNLKANGKFRSGPKEGGFKSLEVFLNNIFMLRE